MTKPINTGSKRIVANYSPDQPRDDHGRFAEAPDTGGNMSGGGSGTTRSSYPMSSDTESAFQLSGTAKTKDEHTAAATAHQDLVNRMREHGDTSSFGYHMHRQMAAVHLDLAKGKSRRSVWAEWAWKAQGESMAATHKTDGGQLKVPALHEDAAVKHRVAADAHALAAEKEGDHGLQEWRKPHYHEHIKWARFHDGLARGR